MKKILAFLIAITATITINATELYDYELPIGDFTALKVVNSINVVYSNNPDSVGTAHFRAPKSLADVFMATNNKGTLKIESAIVENSGEQLPTLYVYSNFLQSVENGGDSTVYIMKMASCPEFKVKLVGNGRIIADDVNASTLKATLATGNGTITLNGQCTDATYKIIGTGIIQADEMQADFVKCKLLGTGAIGCWPLHKLKVSGIGSTKIYYKGNPEISKVGGGKLFKLDTGEDLEIPARQPIEY